MSGTPEVFATSLSDFRIVHGRESASVEVRLPDSRRLERWAAGARQDSLIWVAGGGALLLQNRYLFVIKRSGDAASNPNKWTVPTGFASGYEELADPKRLLREMLEELILIDQDGAVLVPVLSGESGLQTDPRSIVQAAVREAGIGFSDFREFSCVLCPDLPLDEIVVRSERGEFRCQGVFHLDPLSRRANIVFVLATDALGDGASILGRDGEVSSGRPLQRQVALYDLEEEVLRSPGEEGETPVSMGEFTSHAGEVIRRIRRRDAQIDR